MAKEETLTAAVREQNIEIKYLKQLLECKEAHIKLLETIIEKSENNG